MNIRLVLSVVLLLFGTLQPCAAKEVKADTSCFGRKAKIISCYNIPLDSSSEKNINREALRVVVIVNFSKKISRSRLKKIKGNMEDKFGLKQSGFGREYDVQLVSRRPKSKAGQRLLKFRIRGYDARNFRFHMSIAKGGIYY